MFDQIFDAIEEWMRELLTGMINLVLCQDLAQVKMRNLSSS